MGKVHSILSKEQAEAFDIVRWCFAVPKIPADSPRFSWYVTHWNVPAKIAYAKKTGTFEATVARCDPIDPAWLRFVPAALERHRQFWSSLPSARKQTTANSTTTKNSAESTAKPAPKTTRKKAM